MKYKTGDIVQTTANTNPPRKVGKIIEERKGKFYPYKVEFLDGYINGYMEFELRPYKKKSERVKPTTREKKEPSCVHDFRYLEKEETKLPLRHWVKNVNKFYCTKCLEIVSK